MRITIQVTCDSPEDAQDAIARLTRPRTWEDDLKPVSKVSEARLDQIMAGAGAAAPAPSGKDYSKPPEERPNVSPGEPSIGKIGAKAKFEIMAFLEQGRQPDKKFAEHCKLLWARGEIKFDGKEFYL